MRYARVALVVVTLLAFAGCGGDSEDTGQTASNGATSLQTNSGSETTAETAGTESSQETPGTTPNGSAVSAEETVHFQEAIVQAIFVPKCATPACHSSSAAQAGLVLEADVAYHNIVDAPSTEVPSLHRVEPFDPTQSYLYLKITGEQGSVGGTGSTMPLGAPPLPQEAIDTIRLWIEQGAQDN